MGAKQYPITSAFLVLRDGNQFGQYVGLDLRGTGVELEDSGNFLKLVIPSLSAIPGSDTQVIFNDSGSLGADSGLTYDKTGNRLSVLGGVSYGASPATFGDSRYTNDWFLWWRGTGANYKVLGLDSTDTIQLGNGAGVPIVINASIFDPVTIIGQECNLDANVVQVGDDTPDVGDGVRVLGIKNASFVPTTNASDGVIVYAESGAAKCRGSSGTVTTFGPADPHCPTCGRDFTTEHRNDDMGEHLAICLSCLVDALQVAGVDVRKFATVDKRGATKERWEKNHSTAREREERSRREMEERKKEREERKKEEDERVRNLTTFGGGGP